MHPDLTGIVIDRQRLASRVQSLALELSRDLEAAASDNPDHARIVLVPVMTGAMVFTADLIRHMTVKLQLGLVTVSSYPGATTASKGAALRGALPNDLRGAHVVLIDDILDSGRTLGLLRRLILEQTPASLRTCVLLKKDCPRAEDVPVDYVGFEIPDAFVVGYGLDFDGYYRNLPEIGVLRGAEPRA
jgi:hypoxanthine phosphoribosyltransferase